MRDNQMTKVFLFRSLIVFVGILVFAFLLIEPHFEGRNVNSTVFQVYFNDPFLAFVYIGSTPFFLALFHLFRVADFKVDNFAKSLRTIKTCSKLLIGLIIIAEIAMSFTESDDRAGGIALGAIAILGSLSLFAAASFLGRITGNT